MAVELVHPARANDTRPGPSSVIFGNFNIMGLQQDPNNGVLIREDFANFSLTPANATVPGDFTGSVKGIPCFLSANTTVTDLGVKNRTAVAFAGAADNDAVAFSGFGAITIRAGSKRPVGFEACVRFSSTTDAKNGFFVGMFAPVVPTKTNMIQDSGVMADNNFIGFQRSEASGQGGQMNIVQKASGQTQQWNNGTVTLSNATFTKVGFYFDGNNSLKFYQDGVLISNATLGSSALTAATFPSNTTLAIGWALKNATASSPGNVSLDWVQAAMTYSDTEPSVS